MTRKRKQLRGQKLIHAIKAELGRMVNLSPRIAPISVSALAQRLEISRQTIYSNDLHVMIYEFAELQKTQVGEQNEVAQKRRWLEARIDALEKENDELKMRLESYLERWAAVEHNARMFGVDADDLFLTPSKPLRNISRS